MYTRMTELTELQREQVRFWTDISERELNASLVFFDITNKAALPAPADIQHFSSRNVRGFVSVLECGQGARLSESVAHLPWMQFPVHLLLRLPPIYCQLVLQGAMPSVCLPALSAQGSRRCGTSSLTFNWDLLGIRPSEVPCPAQSLVDDFSCEDPTVTKEWLVEVRAHLLARAKSVLPESAESVAAYQALERCVMVTDELLAQTDTGAVQRA
eukprot:15431156-Alexandrium_andersonii.AAC.1